MHFCFYSSINYGNSLASRINRCSILWYIFALLTVTGLREVIINAIPHQMKLAVSAGIGLFITFVGLQSSGIIIKSDSTLVKLGHLTEAPVLLAIFGIIVTVILYAMKILVQFL